jgi:Mg-chelatase subunit ChlD
MTAKAQKFFYANFPDDELGTVTSLNVSASGYNNNLVNVSGSARVDTAFMGLFGIFYLDVSVNVEVTRESKGLEIALALDNTGSMASNGKIQALKNATNELIGILFGDQTTPSHLKMSLVPFSQTVKLDTTTALNNGWMDTTGMSPTARLNFDNNKYAFSVWATMSNKSWGGCVEARPNGYEETDDAPDAANAATLWVPYFEPDGPDSSAYSGYTTYVSDGGSGNQDTRLRRSSKYVNQNKTDPNKDCNLQKILPLTNNKLTLQSYVNGMIATGNTHVALGAAWAWRTLSPTQPFTEGSEYGDPDWTKALVLLTDGLNTTPSNNTWHKSSYTAYNFLIRNQLGTTNGGQSEIEQDNRTQTVCNNIKAAGIRVYSILLEENAQRAKDLMSGCASDPSLYFESPSSADLEPVFQAIAQDLSNLRLSQ